MFARGSKSCRNYRKVPKPTKLAGSECPREICKDEHEYDTDCELPRLIEYLTGCRGVEDIQKHVAEIKYEPTRQQAPAPEVNAKVVSGGSSNDPDSGKGMGKGKLKGKGKGKGWGMTKGFFSKGKASWSWQ